MLLWTSRNREDHQMDAANRCLTSSVYLHAWPLKSLEEKDVLKDSTKFKNEKFIFCAGIFDQEKPRTLGKLYSLLCMDIAWEMCTA